MMKKLLPLLLAAILLLTGCADSEPAAPEEKTISIYRLLKEEYRMEGELVQAEEIPYIDSEEILLGAAYALKSTPENQELCSAFPAALNVLSVTLEGSTADICMNDFYTSITGVEKTLVDGCIALTMCSIPGVNRVSIHVSGERAEATLSSTDILLRNTVLSPEQMQMRLFFPHGETKLLACEYRSVTISDDSSNERLVVDALLEGPESPLLFSAIPENAIVLSVYTQEGVCTVNFSEELAGIQQLEQSMIRLSVYSIVNSLCALPGINSVMISVQGMEETSLGNIDISQPLTSRSTVIGSTVID